MEMVMADMCDDVCDSILSRFRNSTQEDHQHLCATIGAISQALKDQNTPLTPVAYFCAACSSLDSFSTEPLPPVHSINALLTITSILLPKVSVAILKKKKVYLTTLMVRILQSTWLMPDGGVAGLKFVAHMLITRDGNNWSDVSQLYGVLLTFMTDSRPKVRRQAHVCIRDVLVSFQETPFLAPASEGINNMFAKFLLLAGGSTPNSNEGSKGAQEVLYVLDALKESLPLLSLKYKTSILKYFKTLLELHQPVVTRRITDSLTIFCLHPTSEVSPEPLLDLLTSLAPYASTKDVSADGMTCTARLMNVGIKKVYSLNREICVVKLPIVFSALKDILASEHEEAIYASMDAMKSLINDCIDESLINQGVDQIKTSADGVKRKSGPTIIEKVCATIEGVLDYHYTTVWDMAFQIVSAMFDKLGKSCSYLLRATLKSLADMQNLPDEDFPYRKQLHECLGSALGAMGPETFLGLIPLNLDVEDVSEANTWLFPILKQYTVGAHLSFFVKTILGMVGILEHKSQKLEHEGRFVAARRTEAHIYSLWSLLPSFCNYPADTAKCFKDLEKPLCSTLVEKPDIRGIICSSLQILIQQNMRIAEEKFDESETEASVARLRAMSYYTPEIASDNLTLMKSSARGLLSVLCDVFLQSEKDDGGCLQSTIGVFASISDRGDVGSLFRRTMKTLLKVMEEAKDAQEVGSAGSSKSANTMQIDNSSTESSSSQKRAQLLDLAVSFLPGLVFEEIQLLLVVVDPALRDDDGLVQKKAYKVLSVILKNRDEFVSSKLDELLTLMVEVLPLCHFAAKRHRLDCLYFLIVHISKDDPEQKSRGIINSFLTEIILALKEVNKKTRNRAYDMLVQIGHACGDEEKGGKRENLYQFFNMVAGGLAGEAPHMISAAMKGLARLTYEFSDLVSSAFNVLPSTLLLLQRKNREIIKANLGLLKVLVAKSQADGLQMHLRSMVEGLLNWQDNTKNHFKAKVKLLLEMLIKKCGLEAVKAVMPEEHLKLLTNIRKIKERKEKKIATKSEDSRSQLSKATTSRISRWNHSKVFSDFGEEADNDTQTFSGRRSMTSKQLKANAPSLRSKRTSRAGKSLPEDLFDQLEEEPLDLLDRNKTRSSLRSSENLKRKAESDDEATIDPEGRLIISDGGKRKVSRPDSDARSESGSRLSVKSSIKNQKRRKTSESGWAYTGSEYASKKASGDLKRKDKLEPYAYWPLDRKMMSRRPEQRAAARKGMASVVNMKRKLEGKSATGALLMPGLNKFNRVQKRHNKKSR